MRNIGIIFKRELMNSFNTPIAYIFLSLFLGIMAFVFFYWHNQSFFLLGQAHMRNYFFFAQVALAVFVPCLTMRIWCEELRAGTAEILLTLPFKVWELVVGKFLATYAFLLICICMTVAIPITVAYCGDPDWGPIKSGYVGIVLFGGLLVALGGFFSSTTKNQMLAFVISLVTGLVLTVIFSSFFAVYVAGRDSTISAVIRSLGVGSHLDSFERGLLSLKDAVYFLSLMSFFLVLNVFTVRLRKYRGG